MAFVLIFLSQIITVEFNVFDFQKFIIGKLSRFKLNIIRRTYFAYIMKKCTFDQPLQFFVSKLIASTRWTE